MRADEREFINRRFDDLKDHLNDKIDNVKKSLNSPAVSSCE